MQVREAIEVYLTTIKNLQPLTQVGYKQRLTVWASWCEAQELPLEAVNKQMVDAFVEHLKRTHTSSYAGRSGLSTHTQAGYVRVIRLFLRWAADEDAYEAIVSANVIRRIRLPRQEKFVIQTFSSSELQALYNACSREMNEQLAMRDRTILSLLIDCGLRASELVNLTVGNVHLGSDAYIKVMGKGKKEREIGLGAFSRQALSEYLERIRPGVPPGKSVFIGRYGSALTSDGLKQIIVRLGKWAQISGVRVSPHTFRHTFACDYLMQPGADIYKLSLLMGHGEVSTTEHYLKVINARAARRTGISVLDHLAIAQ